MEVTARLAGFFAAHGVWCVSDGEDLIPMVAFERGDEASEMRRFEGETLEEAVETAREWAQSNPEAADRLVVIFDGRTELGGGKTDALIVEASSAGGCSFVMVIPYRNAASPGGFAVHRPKLLSLRGEDSDPSSLVEAFCDGVGKHEYGAPVWNEHLDESR
jgi:hypothetical protein